jgi:type I restriction enzyme S subunit
MRNGWVESSLGQLCEVIAGQSPKGKYYNSQGDGLPFYQGKKDFGEKYLGSPSKWTRQSTREAERGDILMSVRAPVGPINFATQRICIGRGLAAIRAGSKIDRDFLFYSLLSIQEQISGKEGAVFASINKSQIQQICVFFPPLVEQRRIVAILDEAFAGIAAAVAHAEKNLANARELFESYLNGVFARRGDGWVEKKLGELAVFRNGINYTKSSRGESVKIVGVKDFQKNYWAPLDNLDTVTVDGTLPASDTLKENDLLSVRSNGNMELIGRCILVGKLREKISHSGFTIRIRLNDDNVVSQYLCHFLKSNIARRTLIDSGIGTNIKSLNQATLSALCIPFPARREQTLIVAALESLSSETQRLDLTYRRKLANLAELKQTILQKAFAGELTAAAAEGAVA